ncbi:MAG TPA: hypothetical protein VMV81_07505 [Phycisphaerae bacterium]|nr:hypothetical protein [Phycisphaerae bacterium]
MSPILAQTTSRAAGGAAALSRDSRIIMWRQTFFWSLILFLIFLIATWAIVRFTRRFRTMILSGPSSPTPSEDVWSMHKPPEKLEFEDDQPQS